MTIILRSKSQLGFIACIKIYMNIIHIKYVQSLLIPKAQRALQPLWLLCTTIDIVLRAPKNIFLTVADPNSQFQQHDELLRNASWMHLH